MLGNYVPCEATKEELKILDLILADFYRKFKDPQDKFIIMSVFQLGMPRKEAARALGVSYVTVWKRIKEIKEQLEKEDSLV